MVRENNKKLVEKEHISRHKVFLSHTRENIAKCARHGVLFTPSHTRESLLPVSEILLIF